MVGTLALVGACGHGRAPREPMSFYAARTPHPPVSENVPIRATVTAMATAKSYPFVLVGWMFLRAGDVDRGGSSSFPVVGIVSW
eukprot:COSAG01_NODE_816_length_13389_cov_7.068849_4_plen_84_part_00